MKKLALCFSGHPRTFQDCFPSIKSKILDKYDCDIFISTYHMSKDIMDSIIECYNPKRIVFHDENEVTNYAYYYTNALGVVKVFYKDVIDVISLDAVNKQYTIEEAFDYDKHEGFYNYEHTHISALCQFFGVYDVSKLCLDYMTEHNVTYDYIVRLRLDNAVHGEFIFDELEEDEVLVNTVQQYSYSIKLHDHFFLAKPNTYFKIAELYKGLYDIIQFVNNNKCWIPNCGYQETFLLLHILFCGIKITNNKGKFRIQKNGEVHPLYQFTLNEPK